MGFVSWRALSSQMTVEGALQINLDFTQSYFPDGACEEKVLGSWMTTGHL